MSFFKRLTQLIFSARTLVFVAVLLAAAAVWLVGPLLAFGDLHPFASVAVRIMIIALLAAMLLFSLLGWPVSLVGVAALCLLFWYTGPAFGVSGHHPFEPVWIRVLVVSVAAFCYLAWGLYRIWQAMRTNEALVHRILNPPDAKPDETGRAEVRAVSVVVSKAMAQLRRLRVGAPGWGRVLESGRYLYELPWYLMIGGEGAGKTSAILNSGLQFPLPEQMGATAGRELAGTSNCEWWFANEAVLIDTAGRYVEQDVPGDDAASAVNAAEWRGFLGLLRKHRPRAPLNGAILTISVADLVDKPEAERTAHAAQLRARLAELRETLGVRFPVYVFVTKLDLLPGFSEYFQSLTAEGRTQVWGFTLPHDVNAPLQASVPDLRAHCADQLARLEARIDAGLNNRLLEEYEADRRKKLYALPQEFRSIAGALTEMLGQVFLDSRYDEAQLQGSLRGVYLTSAQQTGTVKPADSDTVLQRLVRRVAHGRKAETEAAPAGSDMAAIGHRGYFLRNVFQRVIVPEAHLVRPNRVWEIRFRLLRWGAHAVSIALLVWLAGAMTLSYGNNRAYLATIAGKTTALAERVKAQHLAPKLSAIPALLGAARDLPQYRNVDLDAPGGAFRYGLYTAPGVIDASDLTYHDLLRQNLLPQIGRRMEAVLNAQVDAKNPDEVYRTLTAYLMLFDQSHFDANTVKNWVLRDWERTDSAAPMGGRNALSVHLDALFADGRPPASGMSPDAAVVQRARQLLGANPAPARLYERALGEMEKDAPENFTIARAIGTQAAASFTLVDGSRFAAGVPGLYTYEGFHDVFNKRLPEFLARAQADDGWVMGRPQGAGGTSSVQDSARALAGMAKVADEVRRQYLTDYGNYWQQYLNDIRSTASTGTDGGGTLAFDMTTLRTFAAPDSPLVRLARAAVHQTSLTLADPSDGSLASAVLAATAGKSSTASQLKKIVASLPELRLEKTLVDNRFAALREVVTGQADTGVGPAFTEVGMAAGGKPLQLDALITLINEQYTRLVVADNALSNGSVPPALDIGTALQVEADKLPAPLRLVLGGIALQAADKVSAQVGALLATQIDSSVGQGCRAMIAGKYPFANSNQEVDIDDFNQLFAEGGIFDGFFRKALASYVDTNTKPWRYKALSPGMPPIHGPDLQAFERAADIRDVFFRDPGAKRMAWKVNMKFVSVDPDITELLLDIDGQALRYAHGPVVPLSVNWPGPRGGAMAQITAMPRISPDTSTVLTTGPWALFRLIDRGRLTGTASAGRMTLDYNFDGRHAEIGLMSGGQLNPFATQLLKNFRCPGSAT
jgi:type VI secretion system protein ImpL